MQVGGKRWLFYDFPVTAWARRIEGALSGGHIAAQSDGPGFDSIQWQADDLFITWFNLSVPQDLAPSIYRVAIALYTWPDLGRASLVSLETTAFLERLQVSSE